MNDLDLSGLMTRYVELHKLSPSSRQRHYWRGRIDEFIAQNAISEGDNARARAAAISLLADDAKPTDVEAWFEVDHA